MAAEPESDLHARLGRVEQLLERLEKQPDPAVREGARELLRTVLELHAAGLSRLLELAGRESELAALVTREPLLGGLLALHGLHPVPLRSRVERALSDLTTRLAAGAARAELVSLEDGVVTVALHGKAAFRDAVVGALEAAAPDASDIRVSEVPELVPLRLGRERSAELPAK